MICSNCGNNYEGKFCPNCGHASSNQNQNPQHPVQPQQTVQPHHTGQPRQVPYTPSVQPQPKKKKRGCLIGVLVVLGIFVIMAIIGIASSSNKEPTSTAPVSEQTEAPQLQGQATSAAVNTPPQTTAPAVSDSKKNALKKAKDYLAYSAFSYEGLIAQLEYEKFSHEDAVYGADNCNADWNEQAAKKAKDYLGFSSFSRQGLIDQLLYEKFTQSQAEYGVNNCGASW